MRTKHVQHLRAGTIETAASTRRRFQSVFDRLHTGRVGRVAQGERERYGAAARFSRLCGNHLLVELRAQFRAERFSDDGAVGVASHFN